MSKTTRQNEVILLNRLPRPLPCLPQAILHVGGSAPGQWKCWSCRGQLATDMCSQATAVGRCCSVCVCVGFNKDKHTFPTPPSLPLTSFLPLLPPLRLTSSLPPLPLLPPLCLTSSLPPLCLTSSLPPPPLLPPLPSPPSPPFPPYPSSLPSPPSPNLLPAECSLTVRVMGSYTNSGILAT